MPQLLYQVLQARFYLDIIPDIHRNSVYSLIPTIVALVSVVALPVAGFILENLGSRAVHFLLVLSIIGLFGGLITSYAMILYQPSKKPAVSIFGDVVETNHPLMAELQILIPLSIPSTWKIQKTTKKAWEHLVSIALSDGEISQEEQVLLTNIMANIEKYAALLEEAHEDNIITPEEKKTLIAARDQLWQDAYYQAFQYDKIISHDEHAILEKLLEIIRALDQDEEAQIKSQQE